MTFNQLTEQDFDLIRKIYEEKESKKEAQEFLSEKYDVSERSIRNWAKQIGVGVMTKNVTNPSKVLVYDIETSRIPALVWWSGKQYINSSQIQEEPKIITVAWKWLGEDEVKHLVWDENHSDETLVRKFIKIYNRADLVIGQNNDNFDNRWVKARAAKYNLEVNNHVRSFDLMKKSKREFRLIGYSMKEMCRFFGVEQKLEHEGLKMWDKIQFGNKEEQAEYLDKMVTYNVGDIISTEALYYRLRRYFGHQIHLGVLHGEKRYSCPTCGTTEGVRLYKTTVTPAGTIQRIMTCDYDNTQFKISNKVYMDFLDFKLKENGRISN